MKILTILGARPQFIKAGAVSREIKKYENLEEIVVHTGQHYDANMSDIFFEQMHIPKPDYYLGVGGKSHGAMTGEMIAKLEEVMLNEKPDIVMVYGDTNSTLAGAIAASKLHIPIAHVEAGLRSFNMKMPEEINRILTDRVSKWLFCPTDVAVENLKKEGFENFECKIIKNGDVMQDAALFYQQYALKPKNVDIKDDFVLSTVHRAENTDDSARLREIFEALDTIAKDVQVVLPLHPRTRKKLEETDISVDNITFIEPVGYLEMVWLLGNAYMVITDSGGLQKEAFFFKKPCITLRDETEWVELIKYNFNVLAGAKKEKIIYAFRGHQFNTDYSIDLYGSGKASEKVCKELIGG